MDIHAETARRILGRDPTPEERDAAKVVNCFHLYSNGRDLSGRRRRFTLSMELANLNSEWEAEQRRVFCKHADDPKYPKAITTPELLAQVERLSYSTLTEKAGQIGGGGKLSSQFRNYIQQCSCMCWSSWEKAWEDFAEFMGFKTSITDDISTARINTVLSRPLEQQLRMFKEINENPERRGVVLMREGYTPEEWEYAVARLLEEAKVSHEQVLKSNA